MLVIIGIFLMTPRNIEAHDGPVAPAEDSPGD